MQFFLVNIALICLLATPALATMELATKQGMTPPAEPTPAEALPTLKGKITETLTSGGYTYVNLQMEKESKWIAIPKATVKVGDSIEVYSGTEMGSHHSKSLKRTFPNIMFSNGIANAPPQQEDKEIADRRKAAHASVGLDNTKEGGGSDLLTNIKVNKASGPNAFTVEEAIKKRKELAGQRVVIRGKIVKASKGIMGTNWYHLRDGSGSDTEKSSDLVVTGRTEMLLGDTVTASGILRTDKDFGSGYFYEVIMEETNFSP